MAGWWQGQLVPCGARCGAAWQAGARVGRARAHRKEGPSKDHAGLFDPSIPGDEGVIQGALSNPTDVLEAGGRQPVAIRHQAQKDRQQQRMVSEAGPKTVAYAALFEAGAAAGIYGPVRGPAASLQS